MIIIYHARLAKNIGLTYKVEPVELNFIMFLVKILFIHPVEIVIKLYQSPQFLFAIEKNAHYAWLA